MRQVILGLLLLLMAIPARAADRAAAVPSYQQGNEFFDQCRFADSAAAYSRAIEQDAHFLEAYYNRALADEMVDRQKAIADWRRFADLAAGDSRFNVEVGKARARMQILAMMHAYPEALQPSRYVPGSKDYYGDISESSESETWNTFPLKVTLGNAVVTDWVRGAREAFNIWREMFPLELAAEPQEADIVVEWGSGPDGEGRAGEEADWVQFRRVGGEIAGRKVAHIRIDLSRRWSKDEMRAIMLHEMGHALGIKGHSDSKGDIMYFQVQEKLHRVPTPGVPFPVFWKSLVSKPSQRDLNTLIRLYNTPGVVERMR
jgi:predicted Zn-dependent protease